MNAVTELSDNALQERNALVKRLTELIKTATDEELEYIAEADLSLTPFQVRKQEAALRTIIFKRHGRMTDKHEFFPGEVISVVAEDGNEHLDRAFEVATGVLMINALLSDDHDGAMSLCWAENARVYLNVDPAFLEPFLFGFRWLADHASEWDYAHEPGMVLAVPTRHEIAELVAQRGGAQPADPPDRSE